MRLGGFPVLPLVVIFGRRLTQTAPTSSFVGPTILFCSDSATTVIYPLPLHDALPITRSRSAPPNPQKCLRGAHISTWWRFRAPSCRYFRPTTYPNSSDIDFCRTYHAFSKVLGTPCALPFSRSMPCRIYSFALGTPESSKMLKRGSHFDFVAFPGSILSTFSADDLPKQLRHRFL